MRPWDAESRLWERSSVTAWEKELIIGYVLNFFLIFFFLLPLNALSQMIQNTENICFHIHKTMLINVCEVPVMHIKHLKERKLFSLLKKRHDNQWNLHPTMAAA